MKIEITGKRGEGNTTVSGLVLRALLDFGYTVGIVELAPDGSPLPACSQKAAAEHRAMGVALVPGRAVLITVQSGPVEASSIRDEYMDDIHNLEEALRLANERTIAADEAAAAADADLADVFEERQVTVKGLEEDLKAEQARHAETARALLSLLEHPESIKALQCARSIVDNWPTP